jgi:hypothetical protein
MFTTLCNSIIAKGKNIRLKVFPLLLYLIEFHSNLARFTEGYGLKSIDCTLPVFDWYHNFYRPVILIKFSG